MHALNGDGDAGLLTFAFQDKAQIFDFFLQPGKAERLRVIAQQQFFRGQVDAGFRHPRQGGGVFFNAGGAGRAVHPLYVKLPGNHLMASFWKASS